jgi:hypothetical protein
MKPIRLLYLPNEQTNGDQVGPRKAFASLLDSGELSALEAYSYLVERRRFPSHAAALEDLRQFTEAFRPDLIFWQHVNNGYPVDRTFVRALKAAAPGTRLAWHDPDAYGRIFKPIDKVMKAVIAEADVAVVKGLGYFSRAVRNLGAGQLIFAPESFDDVRFGQPWEPTVTRRFDAIMIANLVCLKRIPFLHLPGGHGRKRLARLFHRAYGERFAVFGSGQGWRGEAYCRGPVAFADQERVIRSSWLSINWGQFDGIPMYSSDRLPISLATGVPHICNYQRGYEHLFPDAKGVYFVRSPEEGLDVADMLLGLPRERLLEIGAEGARYARERLNATRVYGDLIRVIRERLFDEARA